MQLGIHQAEALWILKRTLLLRIAHGTYDRILLESPFILDQTSPTKHVYPAITARAVFSELMLRGATINSKAASTRGKGCHDVMVGEKNKFKRTGAKNARKNGASGSAIITVAACPAAEFRSMALRNIPSLTGKTRFQAQRWSLELKPSRRPLTTYRTTYKG